MLDIYYILYPIFEKIQINIDFILKFDYMFRLQTLDLFNFYQINFKENK